MSHIYRLLLLSFSLLLSNSAWAVDSYRYMHVNIDTPWAIFVFLFFMVFAPMVLAVFLYWRYAFKKDQEEKDDD